MRIALLLLITIAWDATAAGKPIAIYGIGTKQCGEFLADMAKGANKYNSVAAYQYSDWATGFVSGYNYATTRKQTVADLPRPSIIAYIEKYCRDHPLEQVVDGVYCLIEQSGGRVPTYCK